MGISSSEKVRYEVTLLFNAPTINVTVLESNKTNISIIREARKVVKAEKTKNANRLDKHVRMTNRMHNVSH
jgi:hypothetical protein